jgi:thiamine pyrophosphokinase
MNKQLTYQQLMQLIPEFNNSISICANGQFPTAVALINWLKQSKTIIACDGALNNLAQQHINVDYAIGDGDSINSDNLSWVRHPYILVLEQQNNDLTKAVNFVADNYSSNNPVLIFAATGLREDHTIANIALLEQYAKIFPKIALISDFGIFTPLHAGQHILPSLIGQQISIFCFNPQAQISCEQLKWPLRQFSINYLNQGTLNQALSNCLEIEISDRIILYRSFEIKIS